MLLPRIETRLKELLHDATGIQNAIDTVVDGREALDHHAAVLRQRYAEAVDAQLPRFADALETR